MTDRKIYKPKSISGFPEWLPEYRRIEQRWMDHIRRVFESYGYTNIETPAVEEVDVLTAKGEVDKEIYVLERLHKDENDKGEARLALHFDQTVPLARYVAQHFGDLTFPFKRYQMQKVWRGERPQLGRLREFYQCDIDVIGIDSLPLHFDAEMPAVMFDAISQLNLGRVQVRISNRKILLGLLNSFDSSNADSTPLGEIITDAINSQTDKILSAFRSIDKADKQGLEETIKQLAEIYSNDEVDKIVKVISTRISPKDISALETLEPANQMMADGIKELTFVMKNLAHLPDHAVVADLSIIRGLDYYTGTVYEAKLLDMPEFTSTVCAGGRYDDLAGNYISKHLPGVGISIGLSRLFDVLLAKGKITPDKTGDQVRKCPTDVLVVLPSEDQRGNAAQTAQTLRARGLNVELFHKAAKTGDQIKYANNKGIPYVWIPPFNTGEPHKVKNLATGDQTENVDPASWVAD